jgi:hypothetical protein
VIDHNLQGPGRQNLDAGFKDHDQSE